MAKRKIQAWGIFNRYFTIDDEATKGGTIGEDIFNEDGTLFDPSGTTGSTGAPGAPGIGTIASTIWRLILEIPQTVKDIENGPWPTIRNSLTASESFTIPVGRQMIVSDEFDSVGILTVEGTLVIL